MDKCKKCGMEATGHKCDVCGTESAAHDPSHSCGGDHHQPKCSGCGQAESKCTCPVQS